MGSSLCFPKKLAAIGDPKKKHVKVLQAGVTRDASYDERDEKVVERKKQWLVERTEKYDKAKNIVWENIFDETCAELKKSDLTFAEIDALFKKLDTKINRPMLELLFTLFDADNSGTIDKTEFIVSITFLLESQDTRDVNELAFFLFDTNRSNFVSKSEFSQMCFVLMNKARFIFSLPWLREMFRKHMEIEHCVEILEFYEAIEKALEKTKQNSEVHEISLGDYRAIYKQFISSDATKEVNLSSNNRIQVEDQLKSLELEPDDKVVECKCLDSCLNEIVSVMENDSMPRFKEKYLHEGGHLLAEQVWKDEKLSGDSMDKAQFRQWAEKNQGMFSFLEEIRRTLMKARERQRLLAVIAIQRAYRSNGRLPVNKGA
jgi:Ca2+-binding EF-hand superfamily protein